MRTTIELSSHLGLVFFFRMQSFDFNPETNFSSPKPKNTLKKKKRKEKRLHVPLRYSHKHIANLLLLEPSQYTYPKFPTFPLSTSDLIMTVFNLYTRVTMKKYI